MKSYFESPVATTKEDVALNELDESKTSQFYQRGLGLKKEVADILRRDYHSQLVEEVRARNFQLQAGDVTIYLAKEFGFCYGVDRAVDYAYQTREKFPDRRIFLTGEIIHNPHVNNRLIEMGIQFLYGQYSNGVSIHDLSPDDVVILPAFGVSVTQFQELKRRGCILVDTTCGSVLNVWKRVEFYAQNGFTAIIHGKYYHEETIATSSQALKYTGGKYLVVRNMEEARTVCDYILNGGNREKFLQHFARAASANFDPDRDLIKIGVANQTTMLSSESLAIAEELKKATLQKFGAENLDKHFQNFDTICSATQERQDAVLEMVKKYDLDLMIVIGGYNSSNTNHLAVMAARYCKTFHIDDPACMSSGEQIRHKRIGGDEILSTSGWLSEGKLKIGMTAGASTPNNKIGEAIERILRFRGVKIDQILRR
jgi:4-hydroxy-3-methylbut-2-enyl diphosphate reductase